MTGIMPKNRELRYPDGRTIICKAWGRDQDGEYLLVEHRMTQKGAINGPHWHPVLTERFMVEQGTIHFKVDGEVMAAGPGSIVSVWPRQVHQFWKDDDELLVMRQEIRPPGNHWHMFELIHKLETEGLMNRKGLPRNPLWLGAAWASMDGYIAGPPKFVQKVLLGGLGRLAKALGYKV
ncbi:cupin domain-containing protein [Paenibacillus paeoniae]|nr:cupin domain-containing protein [Paenibacillus paeoniae]